MWFLLCAISLRFQVMALLMVAFGRHSLSPCLPFLRSPAIISLLFFLCIPTKTILLLSRRLGIGICIQRQLCVPVLIRP